MKSIEFDNASFWQNPTDPDFANNPYALYSQLHDHGGPVYWHDYKMWCLSDFNEVNAALKSRRFARLPPDANQKVQTPAHMQAFAKAEEFSLLALEPPEHTRLRQYVNKAFVNRQIQQLAPSIEQLANEHIDQFIHKRSTELLAEYATPIPVQVIARLIGVPLSHCDDLLNWSHAMVKVYTMTQSTQDEQEANQAAMEFMQLLKSLITERRRKPEDDLLSQLSNLRDNNEGLSDDEICSVCILLLNAGHEATVHQVGNAVFTLLSQATAIDYTRLFDHPSQAEKTVTELMRVDAPLHLFTRYAQEDLWLSETVEIKRGEQIALLLGAANRDPKKFDQPEQFDALRHNTAHVTLGAGIHFCVGAALAKMEIQIVLNTLFKRIPNLTIQQTPRYRNSFHFHGLDALHLQW